MKINLQGFDSIEQVDTETNRFSRLRNGEYFVKDSDTWTCYGFSIVNNFGHITETYNPLAFALAFKEDSDRFFFKNGKAKFRIVDNDHGTHRMWSTVFKKHNVYIVE